MLILVGLALLGLLVGAFGTIIGVGGGVVLVPILLLMYPQDSPSELTAISLAVVFLNAFSGSIAYARLRRIHFPSGILFSLCSVPGAILGVLTVSLIHRGAFSIIFGVLMIVLALYLFLRPQETHPLGDGMTAVVPKYNRWLGGAVSLSIGFVSSILGIGGGIIHVPFMSKVLRFPVHIATATSHFVLAVTALTATVIHLAGGELNNASWRMVVLGVGVVIGAQAGAAASRHVHSKWIFRGLAAALLIVGVRILLHK